MSLQYRIDRCLLEIDAALAPFERLRLRVARGELVVGACASATHSRRIIQIILGLELAIDGEARFLDTSWADAKPDPAAALRGRIGVARRRDAWLGHMTVLQNLMLAPLHHESRRREEIAAEAATLCAAMRLPGVPLMRPDAASPDELARAAIARAYIGNRRLVVLEEPPAALLSPTVNLARDFCRRGGGVLWLTTDMNFFSRPPFEARRVRLDEPTPEAAA